MTGCHTTMITRSHTPKYQAEVYLREGQEALRNKDLVQAEIAFKQALGQETDYAPALLGLARIDFLQNKLHLAEQKLKACVRVDSLQIPAWLLLGKLYLQLEDFETAVTILTEVQNKRFPPEFTNLRPHLCVLRAKALYGLAEYESADICFKKALSYFPNDRALQRKMRTNSELKRIVSGKENILRRIALKKQITRADLAVLFTQLISVRDSCPNCTQHITDWPKNSIQSEAMQYAVCCGWLPVLPDSTVRPEDTVQRVELAIFASQIMTRYGIGKFQTQQTIQDVQLYKPYYEAVLRSSVYGIIPADNNGYFYPERLLSGEEALLCVNHLSCVLERAGLPFYFERPKGEHCEGY